MTHMELWGQFLIAALLIIFTGFKLTKYGDILSEKLGLGHAFIGAVLIGWSTSLPELVLSIGSATYGGAPNISMGNVLGSNLFNLLIIVMLDIYYWKGPILRTVGSRLTLSAFLSMFMSLLAGGALFLQAKGAMFEIPFLNMGIDAASIFVVYMLCMWLLYKSGKKDGQESESEAKYKDTSLALVVIKSFVMIGIIVGAGLWLSALAPHISKKYALEGGFVGSFFLAIVSSLPEVITCFIAVKMGMNEMALGTLFGSNIFNIAIISFCDIFYRKGNIFQDVYKVSGRSHLSSVMSILLMTFVTIYILRFCNKKRKGLFVGFESIIIALLYFVALYFIYNPSILKPLLG